MENIHLHLQSVPITAKDVSSIPANGEASCEKVWSLTCGRSVVFTGYSLFVPLTDNDITLIIAKSGVKHK